MTIVIPLYIDRYLSQIDFTLEYYNNLGALHEVIVIDDCSSVEIPYHKFKSIKFARIDTDIKWNMPGARNLGAHLSTHDHLVFMDVDHLLPPTFSVDKNSVCLFKRLNSGKEIKWAQGVCAISKNKFKGYDEDFCGNYGKEDKLFLMDHRPIKLTDNYLIALNSRAHSLVRDTTVNQKLFEEKLIQFKKGNYRVPEQLRFKWHLI